MELPTAGVEEEPAAADAVAEAGDESRLPVGAASHVDRAGEEDLAVLRRVDRVRPPAGLVFGHVVGRRFGGSYAGRPGTAAAAGEQSGQQEDEEGCRAVHRSVSSSGHGRSS